eukprot:1725988-Lingulodinium_polyedra.AAC.1
MALPLARCRGAQSVTGWHRLAQRRTAAACSAWVSSFSRRGASSSRLLRPESGRARFGVLLPR